MQAKASIDRPRKYQKAFDLTGPGATRRVDLMKAIRPRHLTMVADDDLTIWRLEEVVHRISLLVAESDQPTRFVQSYRFDLLHHESELVLQISTDAGRDLVLDSQIENSITGGKCTEDNEAEGNRESDAGVPQDGALRQKPHILRL
jgi:hypothetical protein